MQNYNSVFVKKRLICASIILGLFLCALVARLFYVQIISSSALSLKATEQWMRDIPLSALRGTIYDRNGVVLASSYTTYDIYVRPNSIQNKEQTAETLSRILQQDKDKLFEKISSKQSEVLIAKRQNKEIASEIKSKNITGVYLSETSTREYNYNELLCQVLGFCNADGDGQSGIEAFYNKYLAGVNGVLVSETDNAGRQIFGTSASYIPSIPGFNINLTIDIEIQKLAEQAVKEAQMQQGAKKTTAIVMNPNTAEILAMAISPSINLNDIPRDNISYLMSVMRNSAVQDAYEPGSTFKIITGAIAMELGLANENSYFYCPGNRVINGVKINCARRSGHGSQSLEQGFMNSCNCVFMDLVERIGVDRFYSYLSLFNIGSPLAVDFASSASGILMSKNQVTASDLARMGFGQSIALSPLQLVSAVSAIVNGGEFHTPYFVKSITDSGGKLAYLQNPTKKSQVVSPSVSESIRKMLESVVSKGGGKKAQIDGYKIGGKTGTAQKYENGVIAQGKYVASFMGILPADKPEYVVLMIADEPQGSYYGATAAAPYAKKIMEGIIKLKNIQASEATQPKTYVSMPNLLGKSQTEAASLLAGLELYYIFDGEGKIVTSQIPSAGTQIETGEVVLVKFGSEAQK